MKKTLTTLAFLLSTVSGFTQPLFTLTSTTAPANTTYKGITNTAGGYLTFGAGPNGIYIPDVYSYKALQIELCFMLNETPADNSAAFLVKAGSLCWGVNSGKSKLEWIANSGADQCFGQQTLPIGKLITLRYGFDSLGKHLMSMNGVEDLNRPRLYSGPLPKDKSQKFQFFTGLKNFKLKSITVKAKQDMAYTIEPFAFSPHRLSFRYVDASLKGADLIIYRENDRGQGNLNWMGVVPNADTFSISLPLPEIGDFTYKISIQKGGKQLWQRIKSVYNPSKAPKLPTGYQYGFYSVYKSDFKAVKDLGANILQVDYAVINRGPWQDIKAFLDSAQKYSLKIALTGSFYSGLGNLTYGADHPATGLIYCSDEYSGLSERASRNKWAFDAWRPDLPVALDMNNYQRIEELAENSHILICNPYVKTGLIYDVARRASALRPTYIVLPVYPVGSPPVNWSTQELICAAFQGVCGGSMGTFLFDYDRRKTSDMSLWYLPDNAGQADKCKAVFDALKSVDLNQPHTNLSTGIPDVFACRRGIKTIVVNSSPQTVTVFGVEIPSMEVRVF